MKSGAAAGTGGDVLCPAAAAGEAERRDGELLITRAVHSLSCAVSNQGGSWGFRGIKYGLRVNHGRRGLVALTGKSVGAARGRRRGREEASGAADKPQNELSFSFTTLSSF